MGLSRCRTVYAADIKPVGTLTPVGDKKYADEAVQNTPLYKKIKLIKELDEKDKNTILNVIDSLITKNKMKDFLQEQLNER